MAAKPRVRVPKTAASGDVITIKTLISHKMETGMRKDKEGNAIPRQIINRFQCSFNGQNVVDVEMFPSISVNPFFEFDSVVEESGEFVFTWHDDDGSVHEVTKSINVT